MLKKIRNLKAKTSMFVTAVVLGANSVIAASASATPTETPSAISIDFQPSQMFTYSNVIISCLMPVVYITAGLSLGFTIIYALKNAFSSRM